MRRAASSQVRLHNWRRQAAAAVVGLSVILGGGGLVSSGAEAASPRREVLIFHQTGPNLRHASIEYGIAAIEEMGKSHGFRVKETQDSAAFTDRNLAKFDAVIWLNALGVVTNQEQQSAFERYITGGGGYVGVHGPAGIESNWPWLYNELTGTFYRSHPHPPDHPVVQEATINVEDREHPSTAQLPATWSLTEELWNFYQSPRQDVHVLASVDESSYEPGPGAMGDHPVTWCRTVGAGRSWYTNLGHSIESYADSAFRQHLLGGILYATGQEPGDCSGRSTLPEQSFATVALAAGAEDAGDPSGMAVMPDRGVLHASRSGALRLTTPDSSTLLAGEIEVYTHGGEGLHAVAIDPDFHDNRWVYLYYAPLLDTPPGPAPAAGGAADLAPFQGHHQLSRFRLGEDGLLDLGSEQQILQIPADRGICCHPGGDIGFDLDGNLLLSTADNTGVDGSDGFAPIDERPDRNPAFDAQRSAANTNDLRGKLLRITVGEGGTYSIPEGNLFPEGTEKARPEIYAMGLRSPYRFAVDQRTGWIHLGDGSPAAAATDPDRGPAGPAEFNLIQGPGNYGWPYCVGDNQAYVDYDFATGSTGESFDCTAPTNTSVRNTGMVDLPAAIPARIDYDNASVPEFSTGGSAPPFGNGGKAPMGGPTYQFDQDLDSTTKFPEVYDGSTFAYDQDRDWIKELVADPDGEPGDIRPFISTADLAGPTDLEFGPDGSLYVLSRGRGPTPPGLHRIDYAAGERAPVATVTVDRSSGSSPFVVRFSSAGTYDPNGEPLRFAWDFNGDGRINSRKPGAVKWFYWWPGQYTAELRVTNQAGHSDVARVLITVGNTPPTVELVAPTDGGFASDGEQVPFEVRVTDREDRRINCARVSVEFTVGDGPALSEATGCAGVIDTPWPEGEADGQYLPGVLTARYTDRRHGIVPSLTGAAAHVLQPKVREAESTSEAFGVRVVPHPGASGGAFIGDIDPGDWIKFDEVDLAGVTGISLRASASGSGGKVLVQTHEVGGPTLHTIEIPDTGSLDTFVDLPVASLADRGGKEPLYLVFEGPSGTFNVDLVRFRGPGVTATG